MPKSDLRALSTAAQEHADQAQSESGTPNTRKSVPAVRKAVAILALLARYNEPLSLSQIASAIGALPSTCLHILRELMAGELVAIDPVRKRYRLAGGLVELARKAGDHPTLATACQPYLQTLADAFGMTVTVTALVDRQHVALLAYAQPSDAVSINVKPGGRVPVLSGAAGRLFAAHAGQSAEEMERAFLRVRWETAPAYPKWSREVKAAARRGWSEDPGQFTRGVTTMAVPIRGHGGLMAGVLGVGAISAQLDVQLRKRVIIALKEHARLIEAQL
jgi:DNA-binding IclR family transcriptional regulator